MGIIKKHLDYLRDNPEGYWFKRKLYGWGWTPARWQGWVVTVAYIAFILYWAIKLDNDASQMDEVIDFIVLFVVATLALIIICYKTGESPKWQWGSSSWEEDEDVSTSNESE